MAFSLLSLPKNIIQYMATLTLDPRDTSLLRATCKYIHSNINDNAEEYRQCNTIDKVLALSCYGGHLDIAKWCVTNGATDFNHALNSACIGGHLEIAEWCVSQGATELNGALMESCFYGHLDLVNWCISKGATYFRIARSRTSHPEIRQ